MTTSDLYGFKTSDIRTCRARIETLFGQEMQVHESSYVPGEEYYFLKLPDGERLSLQLNYDESEHEWAEDDFCSTSVLLYVEGQDRADELRKALVTSLGDIEFLQREVCTSDRRFLRIRNQNGEDIVIFEKSLDDSGVAVNPT
jgi:hypothetical protein